MTKPKKKKWYKVKYSKSGTTRPVNNRNLASQTASSLRKDGYKAKVVRVRKK